METVGLMDVGGKVKGVGWGPSESLLSDGLRWNRCCRGADRMFLVAIWLEENEILGEYKNGGFN